MRWFVILALVISSVVANPVLAQERGKTAKDYTYAPGSPMYWRNMHGASQNAFVFRRDPNIWVYTKEVAQRAGMPLEWASDEIKGVAAAAFRMEPDGAEEDCGWGRNPAACKPVMRCALDLYFDRQQHQLPWASNRMVADFDWQSESTAYHLLPAMGWVPEPNGDRSRNTQGSPHYPSLGVQPFSDPQTGEQLFFSGARVLKYDREMHGRYSFVRLYLGCAGILGQEPHVERVFFLESKATSAIRWDKDQRIPATDLKSFHEVRLPVSWDIRVGVLRKQDWQRDNDFYKQTWDRMNPGGKQ